MSSFLTRLHSCALRANQSLRLCYPYSILQHARRAVGGDWVLYCVSAHVCTQHLKPNYLFQSHRIFRPRTNHLRRYSGTVQSLVPPSIILS
jgi:hypothetical protein